MLSSSQEPSKYFFKGLWKNHVLQKGHYCKIKNSSIQNYKNLVIESEEMKSSPELKYFPPNYNHLGQHPTQRDPFEINTVEVRGTSMDDMDTSTDQGEGLFVTRDIKQGELISFYSGHIVNKGHLHHLHRRFRTFPERYYLQK